MRSRSFPALGVRFEEYVATIVVCVPHDPPAGRRAPDDGESNGGEAPAVLGPTAELAPAIRPDAATPPTPLPGGSTRDPPPDLPPVGGGAVVSAGHVGHTAIVEGAAYKPGRRAVRDLVFGILRGQSVRLTKIGEALDEQAKPESTERRLSRQLGNDDIDYDRLHLNYLEYVSPRLRGDVAVAVDLSDITKKYATAMEGLGRVWDGSESTADEAVIGNGYYLLGLHGLGGSAKKNIHVPLHLEAYSHEMDEEISHRIVLRQAIEQVVPFVPRDAIWVFDRGFDANLDFALLNEFPLYWLIRFKTNRILIHDGERIKVGALAGDERKTPTPHKAILHRRDHNGRTKVTRIRFGAVPVKLPGRDQKLWMVVVRGFGKKPLVALTNYPCDTPEALERVVLTYGRRWACEEEYRFVKNTDHGLDLEDIRILRYDALRRLVFLAFLAHGFLADLHRSARLVCALVATVWRQPKSREKTRFRFYQLLRAVARFIGDLWSPRRLIRRFIPPKKRRIRVRRGRRPPT